MANKFVKVGFQAAATLFALFSGLKIASSYGDPPPAHVSTAYVGPVNSIEWVKEQLEQNEEFDGVDVIVEVSGKEGILRIIEK